MKRRPRAIVTVLSAAALVGSTSCGSEGALSRLPDDAPIVSVMTEAAPFNAATTGAADAGTCSGLFARHELPHVTKGPGNSSSTFDGTGSGVALGDLDGDGDLDAVLPNLSGQSSILRNLGGMDFEAEPLIVGRFRQAAILDLEGDGDNDIVLTSGVGPPTAFSNEGGEFDRGQLGGVRAATYSMAWGDLGGDGDLDLVTGSYNAELSILRNSPLLGSDTGVVVHDSVGDRSYEPTRIAADAQALAIRLIDIDGDFRTDILVGNDLATPDGAWLDNDGGWLAVERFDTTSFSTMSLDSGDVDNDGDQDVFSTDMAPRPDDAQAAERYVEVNRDMAAMPPVDGVQEPRNVLAIGEGGQFTDAAVGMGVAATGWSWSGVFGDLDSDGFLDIYVVTGMRSDNLFSALADDTLVEPNQVFHNLDGQMSRETGWGLDDEAGGRGMAMGDLDNDGDLDIMVNNLSAPSVVFENQLCGGSNLIVELEWSGSANPAAVGATVEVSSGERTLTRTIDLTRGYLSGGAPQAHFGLGDVPPDSAISVTVLWPDGQRSTSAGAFADSHLIVSR